MKKANVVIAGDVVFAGIDEEDRPQCINAIVIEFADKETMRESLRLGKVEFTVFEESSDSAQG